MYRTDGGIVHGLKDILEAHKGPFMGQGEWSGLSYGKRHKRVTVLWLDSQGLEGALSHIGNLSFLRMLLVSNNSFQGTIPHLYLDANKLRGVIPTNLSDCSNLKWLWLAQSNLCGNIPTELFDFGKNPLGGRSLEMLNSILLWWVQLIWWSSFRNWQQVLCGGLVTLELPKCEEKGSKKKRFPFFIFVLVIAPTLLIVLCCVYLFYKKKHNSQQSQSSGNERFLKVSYNELLKATDGFSKTNLIGEGGFSSIYKGILDSDVDKYVAVKVLALFHGSLIKNIPKV
nr:protein kinase-like domain-containing protein [Tanacetum cinerariifolium]